jgi:hypothetical protein
MLVFGMQRLRLKNIQNAEGVKVFSPASRSARWVSVINNNEPQRGFTTAGAPATTNEGGG